MKMWKKAAALVMALGMTVGFTACGGGSNGGGNGGIGGAPIKGEELETGSWSTAWAASLSATNIEVEYESYFYEGYEGAEESGWEEYSESVAISLADNKIHITGTAEEKDSEGDEDLEDFETYYGEVDGQLYEWYTAEYYEEGEWDVECRGAMDPTFMTGYGLIANLMGLDIDISSYALWEQYTQYEGGVYVLQDGDTTYKFAFKDNLLSAVEIEYADSGVEDDETWREESIIRVTMSYGNASVDELPAIE